MTKNYQINPQEGEIVEFWYNEAQKIKMAVNLEPYSLHKNKNTFNGVITTTQRVDQVFPGDHVLKEGTLSECTKVIADTIVPIPKSQGTRVVTKIEDEDLEAIRNIAAKSIGIDTTTLS